MISSQKIVCSLFAAFCMIFAMNSHARELKDIPVIGGKVIFSDTIDVKENMNKFSDEFVSWLSNSFLKEKGNITLNDSVNNQIVCRVMDYLEVEKGSWTMFAMYMRYTILLKVLQGKCLVEIRNVGYIEYGDKKANKKDLPVFSAEYIFVDKKYKPAFVKNATGKLADKTLERVNEIFAEIKTHINQ